MASRIYMLLYYIQRPLFQVTLTCCSCWLEDSCNCETFFIFFTYMIDANILLVYMFYIKICGGVSAESPWLNLFTSWLIAWFLLGIDDVFCCCWEIAIYIIELNWGALWWTLNCRCMQVYDVTPFVIEHPGGDAIMRNAGADSTVGFYGYKDLLH